MQNINLRLDRRPLPRLLMVCLSFFFVLITNACSQSGQSDLKTVFGVDNRVPITSRSTIGGSIGKLKSEWGHCTATLVKRDIILTAAHCVFHNGSLNSKFSFRPFVVDGYAIDESSASLLDYGTSDPDRNRHADWAILRLDTPLGDEYGTIPVANISARWLQNRTIAAVGYAGDFDNGNTAGLHDGCHVQEVTSNGQILHDCDDGPGGSGGPILAKVNGGLAIVGIHVASARSGNGRGNAHVDEYSRDFACIGVSAANFFAAVDGAVDSSSGYPSASVEEPREPAPTSDPTPTPPPESQNGGCLSRQEMMAQLLCRTYLLGVGAAPAGYSEVQCQELKRRNSDYGACF